MKTLMMTVGLPRSGKSTWARQQPFPIVNPDSIRLAIHGERYNAAAEPFVWATAKAMVKALFLAGHDTVILDATNTTEARRNEWKSPDWTIVYPIFPASKDTCLWRADAEHDDYIKPIIELMAAKYEPLADEEMSRAEWVTKWPIAN